MPYEQLKRNFPFQAESPADELTQPEVPEQSEKQLSQNRSVSNRSRTSISRDEMNLAEFPLAILSTRADSKIKTLEFTDSHSLKGGERIERKWIITGADKFGLPTATDDDVILGLMRLTMDHDFRSRKIYFTRYELLKILRWSTEGRSYSRLTKSLDRLSGVRIRATNSFFDNSLKAYQTKNFGVIDAYEINDSRGSKSESGEQPKSYFIWSESIFDSFKAGYIKKLDLDLYFGLKSSVSRRLYRYLDKHFYFGTAIKRNVMDLAFEKLGLSRNYKYVSSIKQQIEPAAEELVQVGFLKKFEFEGRGSQTIVIFYPAQSGSGAALTSRLREKNPALPNIESSPENNRRNQYIEALASRGISIHQAKRLIASKSESDLTQIEDILRYYDFLVETKDHKISKNRIGFLYKAVEEPFKFVVPQQFKSVKSVVETTARSESESSRRVRPEHKIFRSQRKSATNAESAVRKDDPDSKKQVYQQFVESRINRQLEEMDPTELARVCHVVEQRLCGLQSVLEKDRYKDVLESVIRDEIRKTCDIPSFEHWVKKIV